MATGDKRAPTSEDRWWVDRDKEGEQARPEQRHPPAGAVFFRSVEGYSQEHALANLTDLNLKLLTQANPDPGEWGYIALCEERSPAKEVEKIKRALPLPASARAVVVDSGRSLRVIVTGTPVNERILEFNFIAEASFD